MESSIIYSKNPHAPLYDKDIMVDEEVAVTLGAYFSSARIKLLHQISTRDKDIVRDLNNSRSVTHVYAKQGYYLVCGVLNMTIAAVLRGDYSGAENAKYYVASAHSKDEYVVGTEVIINPQIPPMRIPVPNNLKGINALAVKYSSSGNIANIAKMGDLKDVGKSAATNIIKSINDIATENKKRDFTNYNKVVEVVDYFLMASSMIMGSVAQDTTY